MDGTPAQVNRQPVALVREEWRVVDRWWTEEPVSRRYFEVVLQSGENAVVFREDRKSTRLNSSHIQKSRMPSSA